MVKLLLVNRLKTELQEKRPQNAIFHHDNAPAHFPDFSDRPRTSRKFNRLKLYLSD